MQVPEGRGEVKEGQVEERGGWVHEEPYRSQTSLHSAKHRQEWDWQRNLPLSEGKGGGSGYVIPLLDCELSKHKAQIASCQSKMK